MGNSGWPVSRSKTKTKPDLVIWATASIGCPSLLTVTRRGSGGEIAVPQIVPDSLKMPDALAGVGFQGDHAVGKEIVAERLAP